MNASLIWILISCGLIALDLLLMTIVLLLLGISGLIVALILYFNETLTIESQIALWSINSIVILFVWLFLRKKILKKSVLKDAINQVGYITRYDSHSRLGIVRFTTPVCSKEEWKCKTEENVDIKLDTRVRVIAVDNKNRILIVENE